MFSRIVTSCLAIRYVKYARIWVFFNPYDLFSGQNYRFCIIYTAVIWENALFGKTQVRANLYSDIFYAVAITINLFLYPLSANPTKWSNTLKQFVGNLPTNCLSVFDHFVGLALKGLIQSPSTLLYWFFVCWF